MEWVSQLPVLNASLNGISMVLLLSAFACIKAKKITAHKTLMLSACGSSLLFLVSYVIYHSNSGMSRFQGTGWSRPAYYLILATHIPLAATLVLIVPATLTFALKGRFDRHKRFAHVTFPIWLYVSATGVLVYFFLYQWFPSSR